MNKNMVSSFMTYLVWFVFDVIF